MTITLPPQLEAALSEQARWRGVAPEGLPSTCCGSVSPRRPPTWSRATSGSGGCSKPRPTAACPFPMRPSAAKGCTSKAYLVDTSILARLANTADPFHLVASQAVLELHRRAEVLQATAQNFVEFRNIATRPKTVNGLGLSAVEAEAKAAVFEATFPLLAETPGIYPAWKALVGALGVVGKQVHDARLVAVCQVYGLSHLLTFNVTHFARLAGFGHGVVVVEPASV